MIESSICQQIDLNGQIDARIPDTGRKVSVGQAVQAMVLNGLGFISRPLYLMIEAEETQAIAVTEQMT